MTSKWKFEAPWNGLDDNVAFLDTSFLEYIEGAGHQCIYDGFIPPRMYNSDAKVRAIIVGFRGRYTFDCVRHREIGISNGKKSKR